MTIGFGLAAALWLALRLSVGARFRPFSTLLLDFGVVLVGWGLCISLTARPLVSALVVIGLGIGLIVVDQVKRAVLREAVVFADRAELLEVVRHPRLYLPFTGTFRVLAGAAAIIGGFITLLLLETPLWPFSPFPPLLGTASVLALFVLPGQKPLLSRLRPFYEALGPSRDPARDAQRFGMLAGFVIHATIARAERSERRERLAPDRVPRPAAPGTIILVQSESFFDVSRLDPSLSETVLPAYSNCRDMAYCAGRLAVPCWGANTIRTEFAVLTGLPEQRLGLDRFNPYAAFARVPIAGLAWHARASGWQTVCVHPFDLSFYGRTHVLPMLGFDRLIGPEAFASAPRGGAYVTDVALAERVTALLDETSGGLLVFVITMEGHGPWNSGDSLQLPPALAGVAEHGPLSRFLFRQREADRAIPILSTALRRRPGRGVLAFYGDHQPSLPKAFAAIGLDDERTDYMIYCSDGNTGRRRDIAAHELGEVVREAAGL